MRLGFSLLFLLLPFVATAGDSKELLRGMIAEWIAPQSQGLESYMNKNPEIWGVIESPEALKSSLSQIFDEEFRGQLTPQQLERVESIGRLMTTVTQSVDSKTSSASVSLDPEDRRLFLSTLQRKESQQLLDQVLGEVQFSRGSAVKKFQESSLFTGVKGIPEDQLQKFNSGLARYFDGFTPEVKRRIFSDLIKLPSDQRQSDFKKLGVLVQNSGPAFQKMLQLLGNDVEDPEVKAVLKELLSNVKPFEGSQALAAVEREIPGGVSRYFYRFSEKPIASATIGQVHTARLKTTGEEVVIKILRPGVEERFSSEMKQFRTIFGEEDAFVSRLLSQMEVTVKDEMSFDLERSNYRSGALYQKPKLGIEVAMPHSEVPGSNSVLVLKKARGVPFKAVHPGIISPLDRKAALESLTEVWFHNALFGDGFFHADLHGGNFFYEPLPGKKPPYRLTLIDLGSAGRLSSQQQAGFIELALGCTIRDLDHLVNGVRKIAKMSDAEEELVRLALEVELKKSTSEPLDLLGSVMKVILKQGVAVDAEVLLFNRGRLFLESAIRQLNKELPASDRILLMPLYAKASLGGVGTREVSLLKKGDLGKLWDEAHQRTQNAVRSRVECLWGEFSRRAQ